jgi:hypothetical protein
MENLRKAHNNLHVLHTLLMSILGTILKLQGQVWEVCSIVQRGSGPHQTRLLKINKVTHHCEPGISQSENGLGL